MTSDELREHIAQLTAADRRALRTWIARAYGIDGHPVTHAPAGGTHRQPASAQHARHGPWLGARE